MKQWRNKHGFIIVEDGIQQWLGTDTEYLIDFTRPFAAANAPTTAELSIATYNRQIRNAPVAVQSKASEVVEREFNTVGTRALLKLLATRFGVTETDLITELKNTASYQIRR